MSQATPQNFGAKRGWARRSEQKARMRRPTVVDGRLVPRAYKANGHGPKALRKRRRDEPAAAPSPRARRPRRAVDYAAMEDPDFEGG